MENFTKIIKESKFSACERVDRYTTAVEQTIKWVPATWASYPTDEHFKTVYGEYTVSYNGELMKWHLKSGKELLNAILDEDYGCEAVVYICDKNGEEHQATEKEILGILKECKTEHDGWWVEEGEVVEETSYGEWTGHSYYDLTIHEHTNFFWLDCGELVGPRMKDLDNYDERVEEDE